MTAFDHAIAFTLDHEGGRTTDPSDPGGETWYGLSRRAHPSLAPWPPTRPQAIAQYEREYWTGSRIAELPSPISVAAFDTAVNIGTRRTVSMLQQALRVFDDGGLGPRTTAEAAVADPVWLLGELLARRLRYYASLNSAEDRYELGWARRVLDLHVLCLSLLPGHAA